MTTTKTPPPRTDTAAVEIRGLVKRFGRTTAPSSISVVALGVMTPPAMGITVIAGWLYRRCDIA